MTLSEAIADIERRFIVHEEAGLAVTHDDGTETGARDMTKAPTGEPYVVLSSTGPAEASAYFSSVSRACQWWVYAVQDYAETIAPEAEWASLHLYWREKPKVEQMDYVAMRQAELLAAVINMPLHCHLVAVTARLVICKEAAVAQKEASFAPNGEGNA